MHTAEQGSFKAEAFTICLQHSTHKLPCSTIQLVYTNRQPNLENQLLNFLSYIVWNFGSNKLVVDLKKQVADSVPENFE